MDAVSPFTDLIQPIHVEVIPQTIVVQVSDFSGPPGAAGPPGPTGPAGPSGAVGTVSTSPPPAGFGSNGDVWYQVSS